MARRRHRPVQAQLKHLTRILLVKDWRYQFEATTLRQPKQISMISSLHCPSITPINFRRYSRWLPSERCSLWLPSERYSLWLRSESATHPMKELNFQSDIFERILILLASSTESHLNMRLDLMWEIGQIQEPYLTLIPTQWLIIVRMKRLRVLLNHSRATLPMSSTSLPKATKD